MENKDTNKNSGDQSNKVSSIRTLKDDIARADKAKKMGETIPEPWIVEAHIAPQKQTEEVKKEEELPTINPFVRSDLLPFKDGESPENPKKTAFGVSPIRTYTDDVAQAVKTENTSVIQIAVREQEEKNKRQEIENSVKSQSGKNILKIVGSLIFLALSAGIIYYIISTRLPEKITETPRSDELIVAESEKEIIFTQNQKNLLEKLRGAVKIPPPASSIQNIKIVKEISGETITSLEFVSLIAENIPQSLARSFNPKFVFGVYGGEQPTPYIILKIDSFENAFAGMLKWEENIKNDIGGLFWDKTLEERAYIVGDESLENATNFKDSIIKNQDTRVTVDDQGKIILLYAFVNKDILIITGNKDTFNELTERLKRVQILR